MVEGLSSSVEEGDSSFDSSTTNQLCDGFKQGIQWLMFKQERWLFGKGWWIGVKVWKLIFGVTKEDKLGAEVNLKRQPLAISVNGASLSNKMTSLGVYLDFPISCLHTNGCI